MPKDSPSPFETLRRQAEPLRQRWLALAPRERVGLGLAALALGLFLLWSVAVAPALRSLSSAPARLAEIDTRLARRLAQRLPSHVEVVADDFLTYRLPPSAHVLVGNLPFHQTTAMLRRILHAPAWTDAIVLVQWEVARRRAGVGGATMMTAQWGLFEFERGGALM